MLSRCVGGTEGDREAGSERVAGSEPARGGAVLVCWMLAGCSGEMEGWEAERWREGRRRGEEEVRR